MKNYNNMAKIMKKPKSVENGNNEKFKAAGEELFRLAINLKEKYKKTSPATRKKIIAGVIGGSALIATAIGMKKMKRSDD
ncbi:hypothetical protein A2303_04835 [Candidatus Falkowbacteria bacterium RIFOXYB2_FULL_47_14]|uniref:Uncharacterized protein n=1 Tax=Candidatus Falkowbacteria bacterium RIFOXYA2_FULL_47_19 TaxID=1797994 RepID=A0A1F5SH99_9BACT|nr:MAG: hypothetical protein A2227_02670 [Candidatus Falkowbacteria bacterium RIFOXYA2_FULL_47_19]OGF35827.1 MAG: hypothetical protein A2468_03855 [Candidatus Falkowbacteria bacterium RIFOXYC2_FULL_46_15]OGF42700.1 MAG: hypothetical protein A2303_04835 [Candidatus Falkowbacteria bacterium RIFOXYB2_FULL_47_14]